MFCTPPATTRSFVPLITAWAAKCTACCDEPHWRSMVVPGHLLGQAGGEPARAGDVAGLRADGVDAAEHDVVDGDRVDAGALDERLERRGAPRSAGWTCDEPAAAPADRGADGVDDVGLGHGGNLSVLVRDLCRIRRFIASVRRGEQRRACANRRRRGPSGPAPKAQRELRLLDSRRGQTYWLALSGPAGERPSPRSGVSDGPGGASSTPTIMSARLARKVRSSSRRR